MHLNRGENKSELFSSCCSCCFKKKPTEQPDPRLNWTIIDVEARFANLVLILIFILIHNTILIIIAILILIFIFIICNSEKSQIAQMTEEEEESVQFE